MIDLKKKRHFSTKVSFDLRTAGKVLLIAITAIAYIHLGFDAYNFKQTHYFKLGEIKTYASPIPEN